MTDFTLDDTAKFKSSDSTVLDFVFFCGFDFRFPVRDFFFSIVFTAGDVRNNKLYSKPTFHFFLYALEC